MRGYATKIGRINKAKKIVAILEESFGKPIRNMKILDIGTGNGEIANYISLQGNDVYSVDVQKNMSDEEMQFHFTEVKDEKLPFEDDYFDIVISNHVIEHMENGMKHLHEINRVLKVEGICYFATPNRNFPKEAHTKTLFIHWFPSKLFWRLLKILNKYQEPIRLLSHGKMKKEFINARLSYKEWTMKIINNPQKYFMESEWRMNLPQLLSAIAPTNVFLLTKN